MTKCPQCGHKGSRVGLSLSTGVTIMECLQPGRSYQNQPTIWDGCTGKQHRIIAGNITVPIDRRPVS